MAQIPVYANTATPQQPPNLGTESLISAARRVGALEREGGTLLSEGVKAVGAVAGDYFQRQEDTEANKEIRNGLVQTAEMEDKHTNLLQIAANNGDPMHPQAFNDHVLTPDGEAFLSQFKTEKGRKWAEDHIASYTAQMIRQSSADHAIATGNETVVSLDKAKNAAAAQILRNPGSADFQIQKFNKTVDALIATSGLKPAEASKVGTILRQHGASELATAAIQGVMDQDPDAGVKLLESGKYDNYLSGSHVEALQRYAEGKVRASRADDAAQRALDNHMRTEADRQRQDDYIGQMQIDDKGNTIYPPGFGQNVINDPNLSPSSKRVLLTPYKHQLAQGASKTSDAVRQDLTNRLLLPDDDPRHLTRDDVLQRFGTGELHKDDLGLFLGQIKHFENDPAAKELLKTTFAEARQTLNLDGSNPAAVTRFQGWFWPQYKSGLSRGLTPEQLLNPESKDYLLKGDKMKSFQAAAAEDAVKPVQERQSSTAVQQSASKAVDIALQVQGLSRNNNLAAVNDILKSGGVKLDVTKKNWTGELVNSALVQAGLPPAKDQNPDSFKSWGFPIDAQHVQKGDVFYSPSRESGGAPVVGFATGNVQQGPNGLQVQVVSSQTGPEGVSKYATGNAAPGGPSSANGIHPEFGRRIDEMAQAMPPDIRKKFAIISGFRDSDRQQQVYREQHPGQIAPTNSYHTNNIAADVERDPTVLRWINQNGSRFGVGFTLGSTPGEENHLEPTEGGKRIPENRIAEWASVNQPSGGVEWRDAKSLLFRRAKPSVAEIANAHKEPGALSKVYNYMFKGGGPLPAATARIPGGAEPEDEE